VSHGRAALAATGVILSAVYMLWMYQRVIWGEITNIKNELLADMNVREKLMIFVADSDWCGWECIPITFCGRWTLP